MKRTLFFALFILFSFVASAQTTAKTDATGNYTEVKVQKTEADLTKNATKAGKTFTATNGKKYDLWLTANDKLFYVAISKTGNPYRRYIKVIE